MPTKSRKAIIICGPTASGKTDYAHHYAIKNEGEVLNCDSMQVYRQIPIITASPSLELTRQLPYHLYNFLDISEEFSVAKYLSLVTKFITETISRGNLPVIVGGSGMYVNSIINGINSIPDISKEIRDRVRNESSKYDLFKKLAELDPLSASRLNPGDSQRIMRAYEVFLQTGKSIVSFYDQPIDNPFPDIQFEIIFLLPERNFLYETCDLRLKHIFNNGAIDEIEMILKNHPISSFSLQSRKALGVSQIIDYLEGRVTLSSALEEASAKTRQYAKRQITWFKHQISQKRILHFSNLSEYLKLKEFACSKT